MEVAYSLTGQRHCPKVDRKLGREEGLPEAKLSAECGATVRACSGVRPTVKNEILAQK